MRHKTIQIKLLRFLDDDLAEREKAIVQRHLEGCRTCRDALKTVESMWVLERPMERETAPPFLWTRISARLQIEAEPAFFKAFEKPLRLALPPVVTTVVLLFIFFSGIKLGNLITGSTGDVTEISTERVTDNFGMSYFEILPPGSINAHALALTESEMQK
jgi:predicted anti-sigma-YlaC factor YlaD